MHVCPAAAAAAAAAALAAALLLLLLLPLPAIQGRLMPSLLQVQVPLRLTPSGTTLAGVLG
jgi:hypothetical protein